VNSLTCQIAVHRAYDQLAGLLPPDERVALEEHLATCDRCADLMAQLRDTIAILQSRRRGEVPDVLRDFAAAGDGERGADLVRHLPQLYALSVALDPANADDLVQETVSRALADPTSSTSESALAATLTDLAARNTPVFESPPPPPAGEDPDADTPELFYPGFYAEAADPGAWVEPTVAWGEALVLRPDDEVVTTELYGVVDEALAELDPIDRNLVSLVDFDRVSFGQAVMELDLGRRTGRARLAHGRSAVHAALDRYIALENGDTR
jgi:DNA-directed RNA polymerase specialized sigma24 family protein